MNATIKVIPRRMGEHTDWKVAVDFHALGKIVDCHGILCNTIGGAEAAADQARAACRALGIEITDKVGS